MGRVSATVAAIAAWVGWLTVCPALGFPTLATAAMFNRVFVPRENPGFWLGWVLLLIGLAAAALIYAVVASEGRIRPSVASGAVYGVICWLIAGAIVMPLLGLALPSARSTTPTAARPPDPMAGSFMMLHLGPAAAGAALVAWVLFGAVLGVAPRLSRWSRDLNVAERRRALILAGGVAVVLVLLSAAVASLRVIPAIPAVTSARTLASGPLEALPEGASFVSVIDLVQAPGATLGPHAHVAGFAYDRGGVEILDFGDGKATSVGPGEGGFMGAQERHSHINTDRAPAAIVAVLIVAAAVGLCATVPGRWRRAARLSPALLALLIGLSVIGVWNPWSNDWLFISVRPVSARGAVMPLPTSSRVYESPDLNEMPPGPYIETLQEITLTPGAQPFEIRPTAFIALVIIDGRVRLESAAGSSQVGRGEATLVQRGSSLLISDAGQEPVRVLSFGVAPAQ